MRVWRFGTGTVWHWPRVTLALAPTLAVIVARGAAKGPAAGAGAVVCVVMGYVATMVFATAGAGHEVPALPFSIGGGVAAVVLGWWVVQPYADAVAAEVLSNNGAVVL